MITTEVDFSATTKPEGNTSSNNNVNPKLVSPSTTQASSSSWTRLKDPRIVRVSRAFGGKDRHSKVCTVRGLRDRRVRLSVPTAIQLYDLQDRLGLNQPSKVVDWLLDVAKNEIDELPPLQLPPSGNFNPNLQQWLCSAAANQAHVKDGVPLEPSGLRGKSKEQPEQECDDEDNDSQDQNWNRKSEEEKQQQEMLDWISPRKKQEVPQQSHDIHQHHPNNLFQRSHNNDSSPLPNLLNNNAAQFNSFLRWDPSSLSLSHHQPDHHQVFQNFNVLPLTSPSGLPHSFFHPQSIGGGGGAEFEPSSRQINFHMLSSGSQHPSPPPVHDFSSHSLRPLHFLASHNHSGSEPNNKENEFHSR